MKHTKPNSLRSIGFITILLGLIFCETSCSRGVHEQTNRSPEFQRLNVEGDERHNGIFDASVEYSDNGIGWLSYSSITIPKFVETHIAKSVDHGNSWSFVTKANTSHETKLELKNKTVDAVWRYETPSLLFDPADKPDRRWKLFTNRYPVVEPFEETDRLMVKGSIEVQYSSSPDRQWSKPVCVIGPATGCGINLASSDPALADVKFMTELGTVIENGVIYMSMDVGTTENGLGEWERYRVVLFASNDHGSNWHYVGTLLDHKDAMRFNYLVFTGTSLVRENGKLYLFATPSGATNKDNRGHDGTMIMELADISHAQVARDKMGRPIIVKRIEVEKQSGGLADYDEQNTAGGIVMPQFTFFGIPEVFQIWNTKLGITNAAQRK